MPPEKKAEKKQTRKKRAAGVDHAAIMNSCDAKASRVGLAALSDVERVVVLVSRANFEIDLGGLSGFFSNSAGEFAAETAPAFEAVGAVEAASALRAALSKFPGGSPPSNQKQVSQLLDALTSEIYSQHPVLFDRLCSYIDAHADELREHQ